MSGVIERAARSLPPSDRTASEPRERRRLRIALLGAGEGGGHRAVMAALAEAAIEARAEVAAYPRAELLAGRLSRFALTLSSPFQRFAERRLVHCLAERLRIDRPQLAIVTQPWIAPLALAAAKRLPNPFACVAVCNDPGHWVRPGWAQPGFQRVFAPSEAAGEALIARGLLPEQVEVCGLPVRRRFFAEPALARDRVLRGLGLDPNRPAVLVLESRVPGCVGAHTLHTLFEGVPQLSLIFVAAGPDMSSFRALAPQGVNANLAVVGHTRELELLFSVASALIASPGGSLIFEAAVSRLPFVAWLRPGAPRQRLANARWLRAQGLGVFVRTPRALVREVARIVFGQAHAACRPMRLLSSPSVASQILSKSLEAVATS